MPPSSSICFRRLAGRRDSASLACFLKHGGIWFDPLGRFAGFAPEYGRASPPGADRRDACQFAHWPCALFAIGGRDAGPWHAAKIVGGGADGLFKFAHCRGGPPTKAAPCREIDSNDGPSRAGISGVDRYRDASPPRWPSSLLPRTDAISLPFASK